MSEGKICMERRRGGSVPREKSPFGIAERQFLTGKEEGKEGMTLGLLPFVKASLGSTIYDVSKIF